MKYVCYYHSLWTKEAFITECIHYDYDEENKLFKEYDENNNLTKTISSDEYDREVYKLFD